MSIASHKERNMGPPEMDYGVDLIDSIVLGAAENAARKADLVLSAPAKDYILRAARPLLDEALEQGKLEDRRKEAERSTQLLIEEIARLHLTSLDSDVTSDLIDGALERLCRKFPKLYPFCPRP
jgi:hypothetical protein